MWHDIWHEHVKHVCFCCHFSLAHPLCHPLPVKTTWPNPEPGFDQQSMPHADKKVCDSSEVSYSELKSNWNTTWTNASAAALFHLRALAVFKPEARPAFCRLIPDQAWNSVEIDTGLMDHLHTSHVRTYLVPYMPKTHYQAPTHPTGGKVDPTSITYMLATCQLYPTQSLLHTSVDTGPWPWGGEGTRE